MGFTDGKDVSGKIRTRFTDTFLVFHNTREPMERIFVMNKTQYKGHLAWLLLIYTFGNLMGKHLFLTLHLILYMFEDIFCWHTYPKIFQTYFFLKK